MAADTEPSALSTSLHQQSIHKPKLLLVEGREDLAVFRELRDHSGIEDVQIMEMEGINNLRARLDVLVRDHGFRDLQVLAIARDADDNAQSAFQSVRSALAGCPPLSTGLPSRAGARGAGKPVTSVFIVPDNVSRGNLETMLNGTRAGDTIDRCIDEYFDCLGEQAGFDLSGGRLDKARAHARIAASSNPARSVGHSVRASGVWDLEHESLEPIRTFLSEL